jgi:hypothetical protein
MFEFVVRNLAGVLFCLEFAALLFALYLIVRDVPKRRR